MKHNLKITAILLGMFLLTQFIGLYVINAYTPHVNSQNQTINPLPNAFQTPEPEDNTGFWYYLAQIIPAFIIAILLVMFLSKYKFKFIIKLWFFIVIFIALSLAINAFLQNSFLSTPQLWGFGIASMILALALTILKVFRPTIIIHNFTELLIYPGIAAVFVPILNVTTAILILIAISLYDMWAVWKSGIMQKMAKFQMEEVKIFGGFLIPSISKKLKEKLKKLKNIKTKNKSLKNKKIKVSLAILGGGDVVFPIIVAGVFLRMFGLYSALCVTFGALAGLTFLLSISEKKKFYPAMPFISTGIFLGMILAWLLFI